MKKSFASRRVPRKIGTDNDDDDVESLSATSRAVSVDTPTPLEQPSSAVKRPTNKSRKSSALRTSFAPSANDDDDNGSASGVIVPKRSNLSRLVAQRNAEKRPASELNFRAPTLADGNRPSYSKDYLDELKQSTPNTPKDQSFRNTPDPAQNPSLALDIASKFGTNLSAYQLPTAIPSDAEIREKKERRARLAKEQDFITLDDGLDENEDGEEEDDDNVTRDDLGRLILKPKEKSYAETRLVRDDEDMFEGFDEFTSDARIGFGGGAEKEAARKRKAEMASLIADAEGQAAQESDEDDSEAERNAAFEVAQIRHGNYGTQDPRDEGTTRSQTPPKIAPLPNMEAVVERLRKQLEQMEIVRMAKTRDMQRLVEEKASIGEEEVRVQAALKETAERYSKLREDARLKTIQLEVQTAKEDGDDLGDGRNSPMHIDQHEGRPGLGNPRPAASTTPSLGLGAP